MVATISFNPQVTTVATNSFDGPASTGLVQGTAYPDPAIRWKLASGWLLNTEPLPMWGGVGIFTNVPGGSLGNGPNGGPIRASVPLGPPVGRATSLANLVAFSVFDQVYGMINTPQSPVPLAASYMQVGYYRLGSGARIAVAADSSLVSLQGGLTTTDVSWDFTNQKLIPYLGSTAISSGTYNSTTGVVVLTFASAPGINVGDTVTVSGATGTGSFASINGTVQVTAVAGATISYVIATGLTLTITGANVATSGILPVQVLDIQQSNNQTVVYDPNTGFATWNYNGPAAVILI